MAFAVSPLAIFLRTVDQMPAETIKSDDEQPDEKTANQIDDVSHNSASNAEEADKKDQLISNQPQTIKAALKEAFTSVTFLLITLGFTVCGFHVSFIATHLPAYLQGHGIDSSLAGRKVHNYRQCCMIEFNPGFLLYISLVCFNSRLRVLHWNSDNGVVMHQIPSKIPFDHPLFR
jgi:hypothetical protein